jgi:hypothetical protein
MAVSFRKNQDLGQFGLRALDQSQKSGSAQLALSMGPFNFKFIISAAGERVGFCKRPFPVSTTSPFGRCNGIASVGALAVV